MPAIRHVLTRTLHDAEGYDGVVRPLAGHFAEAAAGVGSGGPIVTALETFMKAEQKQLNTVLAHVVSSINGAQTATGIYIEADHKMADSARSADRRHR